jgi:peroxiredoxin
VRLRLQFVLFIYLLFTSYLLLAAGHALKLEGIDGEKHALNDYVGHGKWVVVNVWATACPYCRHELYDLTNFHNAHQDKEAIVVGLTIDWPSFEYPEKNYLADFASSHFIDYPILMADGELASRVIGQSVDMVPISFLYNPEGKLVKRINGMVTEKVLEEVIRQNPEDYHLDWADVVPPEYLPKE